MVDLLKFQNRFKNIDILFVEDELKVRELTNSFLQKFFHNVLLAEDGDIALEVLKENKVDILITDIDMPRLNGIKLVQEVKKNNPEIFVIFITALREEVDPSTYDLLFLKPLGFDSMVNLIEKIDENFVSKKLQ